MAEIVLGIGTSHSPMFALPPSMWDHDHARMSAFPELVFPPDGVAMSYDEAMSGYVSDDIKARLTAPAEMVDMAQACERALSALAEKLADAQPDVLVIVSDDQDEWFFENNMPTFAVYWGPTVPLVPLSEENFGPGERGQLMRDGYGDKYIDVPVASRLGRSLVEGLIEREFDPAHIAYVEETYGGRVARRYPTQSGELDYARETPHRRRGLPHGFSFVVKRLTHNNPSPIIPVFQNTCYPPTTPTSRRSYDFGVAIGDIIATWPDDLRVAVIASGGLSHFVVDEEFDRLLLGALESHDVEQLRNLPRHRMYSATAESLNWVTVAGVMSAHASTFSLIDYVPVYRTEAGTGGGWAFGHWS